METDKKVYICATNGNYNVLRFGRQYTILKKGLPIKQANKWFDKNLLYSLVAKGGYKQLNPEVPYEE